MKISMIVALSIITLQGTEILGQQNPLLSPYQTPFETVPFDKLKTEDFMPAIQVAIANGRSEVNSIAENPAVPDFDNTVLALEQAGRDITRIFKIISNLNSMETTPAIQKAVREISPLLTEYRNDISMNEKLFNRVKKVYESRNTLKLDSERTMLLEKSYKSFARNGALLDKTSQEKLRSVNKELSELSIKFGENVLSETNQYSLYVEDESKLKGLPGFVLDAAKEAAVKDGKQGWKFTLQAPSYSPFMQYAENRELRKMLFMAYQKRGYNNNANDNSAIIQKLVELRHEKARILGYETWADYILEERMANDKNKVTAFLEELRSYAEPKAMAEMEELTAYAKKCGFSEDSLQRWDYAYYMEKLKKEKFDINDEILKPYFKLDYVIEGLFGLCNDLFGITFKKNNDIKTWHPDVMVYEIYDKNGEFLAIWYGDYFPRPGKRAGAWNNTLQDQWVQHGKEYRPHVLNICNFSKPAGGKPSLLTFDEVETLYHEFGHALHNIFAAGNYASLTGTSVPWDFVELPSQIMENFANEPALLQKFARHYETGEAIPVELIEKLKKSTTFMSGMANIRQLSFGLTDMAWHGKKPEGKSIEDVEKSADITRKFYPGVAGIAVSPAFSHIFAGGYSAGYYSYKWSEVLDADAYEAFKEKGIFSKEVAESFRSNILSKGGSEHPMELFVKFRGREPKPDAMLKRSGLIVRP
jgi:peptidyl-dipeptidase Dcp